MPLLSIDNLCHSIGQRVLFDRSSLVIDSGERVGLVGDNGAGKSTLFRIIVGELKPDSGTVALGKSVTLGHLPQDPTFTPGHSLLDEAELAFADLHTLAQQLRDLEHDMAGQSGQDLDQTLARYEKLRERFEQAGGYAWKHRLEATLLGVGLARDIWSTDVEKLSGGQRSRLALAKILINKPDLLLLDEPTNHLDLQAIDWLENWLTNFDGGVLLISHDRALLDRLATRIAWLDRGTLRDYPGNFASFVEQRHLQQLTQSREHEKQQAYIAKQQEFIRRFSAGQRAREAQGRAKKLARLLQSDAMVSQVRHSKQIHLDLRVDQRAGDQVLRVRGLCKSFDGRVIWKDVDFDVTRGQRVGIIGPNGSGKTTLLRTLLARLDADAGEIRWGASLKIAYYDQQLDEFDPDASVLETACAGRENLFEAHARDLLAGLLFRGDDVFKPMSVLSGGETARVALAQLMLDRPNVMLLDEPTNHLDINSAEALEGTLKRFDGTLLAVSHDRAFLERITDTLLIFDPPGVTRFDGGFSAWQRKLREQRVATPLRKSAPPAGAKESKSSKESRRVNRDDPYKRPFGRLTLEQLEAKITETEIELAGLQERLGDPALARDPAAARQLVTDYETADRQLKALEAEYFSRDA